MNMSNEEFTVKLEEIYAYMKGILSEKNKSYGGSAFEGEGIFPVMGNYVRLTDKMNRYKSLLMKLMEKGGDISKLSKDTEFLPFNESLWDTVCDILGYASIGLVILDSAGLGKLPASKVITAETLNLQHIDQMFDWYQAHGNDPIDVDTSVYTSSIPRKDSI